MMAEPQPISSPSQPAQDEGNGEPLTGDRRRALADTRTIQRAIRERWPIPEGARAKVVSGALELLDDPKVKKSSRAYTRLGKLLVDIDKVNVAEERAHLAAAVPPTPTQIIERQQIAFIFADPAALEAARAFAARYAEHEQAKKNGGAT